MSKQKKGSIIDNLRDLLNNFKTYSSKIKHFSTDAMSVDPIMDFSKKESEPIPKRINKIINKIHNDIPLKQKDIKILSMLEKSVKPVNGKITTDNYDIYFINPEKKIPMSPDKMYTFHVKKVLNSYGEKITVCYLNKTEKNSNLDIGNNTNTVITKHNGITVTSQIPITPNISSKKNTNTNDDNTMIIDFIGHNPTITHTHNIPKINTDNNNLHPSNSVPAPLFYNKDEHPIDNDGNTTSKKLKKKIHIPGIKYMEYMNILGVNQEENIPLSSLDNPNDNTTNTQPTNRTKVFASYPYIYGNNHTHQNDNSNLVGDVNNPVDNDYDIGQ